MVGYIRLQTSVTLSPEPKPAEAAILLDYELPLEDPKARSFWPLFRAWVRPNLGKKELP